MNAKPTNTATTSPNRAYALDALRGFAILAMLLSGQEPFGSGALPAWMYHGQEPPPAHDFLGNLPGITWVDLVFPFFLFCMGAAFPLAFSRRMDHGAPKWRLGLFILERGFLLGFFALYVQAIRPYTLSKHPDTGTWLLALLAFLLLFPVLTRLPEAWPAGRKWAVKGLGWLGAMLFLALAHYPDGAGFTGFSLERSDIIIVVLTNMAVFGSLVWMFTRHSLPVRLGVMGLVLAFRLSNLPEPMGGWTSELWKFSPAPWIYKFYYLQYLCIVIPGTIAGDLILRWTRESQTPPAEKPGDRGWPAARYLSIASLMFAFVLVLLAGLETRVPAGNAATEAPGIFFLNKVPFMRPWLWPATGLTFCLCAAGGWWLRRPGNASERLYQQLFHWGVFWLVLGLICEPYEGGIKKDHPTLSYYFITSGLASCVLIGFSIIIDRFQRRRWLQLLIDNGQNPMIAYAGINNFITPVLMLTMAMSGLTAVLSGSPWLGFLRGLIITLLMAITVSWLTRRKIFWRT